MSTAEAWDQLFNLLGIKDFIYFISSPQLQDMLFPVRLIFICFSAFFLIGIVYFMLNSSWLNYKFLEDVTEFFTWQPYGMRQIVKRWDKIKKRAETGSEAELKLAVIEADDFLNELLEEKGYEGENFEEIVKKADRLITPNTEDLLWAHNLRNSIVYDPNFKLDQEQANKALGIYGAAVNNLGAA